MTNWVPTIQHITNGEEVSADQEGRVSYALAQRTQYLYDALNNLTISQLVYEDVPRSTVVVANRVAYINSTSKLLELTNAGDVGTALAVGLVLETSVVSSGPKAKIVTQGKVTLTASEYAALFEGTWSEGAQFYLSTTDGLLTFSAPPLNVPMGTALYRDSSGNSIISFDPNAYLNLQHRHIREVIDWVPLSSGGTGAYTLTYAPTDPSAVFATVENTILDYDDTNVGSYSTPGDPDFVVSGTTLQIYSPARFEITSNPKLVVWYTTPFGASDSIGALVQGSNVRLTSTQVEGNLHRGTIRVDVEQALEKVTSDSQTLAVKDITLNSSTKALTLTMGQVVTQLKAGSNIYLSGGSNGQGIVTVSARATRDSYAYLASTESFLEGGAQRELLFNQIFAASIRYRKASNEVSYTFDTGPNVANGKVVVKLRYTCIKSNSGDVELVFNTYVSKVGSSLDITPVETRSIISCTPSDTLVAREVEITLDASFESQDKVYVSITRGQAAADTYPEKFSILGLQMRYTPKAV